MIYQKKSPYNIMVIFMRKSNPIQLDIIIPDDSFIQDKLNSLFIDITKNLLDNSNSTYREKIDFIDKIIDGLKSE